MILEAIYKHRHLSVFCLASLKTHQSNYLRSKLLDKLNVCSKSLLEKICVVAKAIIDITLSKAKVMFWYYQLVPSCSPEALTFNFSVHVIWHTGFKNISEHEMIIMCERISLCQCLEGYIHCHLHVCSGKKVTHNPHIHHLPFVF